MTEKIKIRGLALLLANLFIAWGVLVGAKSLYDLFVGEPEANAYSVKPWTFVTREQWMRYGGFELAYALACLGLGAACRRYSRFLPETIERRKPQAPDFFR